jgi:hypothetical protein
MASAFASTSDVTSLISSLHAVKHSPVWLMIMNADSHSVRGFKQGCTDINPNRTAGGVHFELLWVANTTYVYK